MAYFTYKIWKILIRSQKRRYSIRIWSHIINDSFKKSSRPWTGLGPSEEPDGELMVENVPLIWVLCSCLQTTIHSPLCIIQYNLYYVIHTVGYINVHFQNFKLSSEEFSQSGFSDEFSFFPDTWIKYVTNEISCSCSIT